MFIKSGEISLRAVEPSDGELLYIWENDMALWRVSDRWTPFSMFEIDQLILGAQDIHSQRQIRLMIDLQKDNDKTPVGTVDLYDFDILNSRAGIGVFVVKEQRRKGIARTAIKLAEKYCFKTLNLHQVYALVDADNLQSIRLFQSLNYRHSGKRIDWVNKGDTFVDQLLFQKMITDYQLDIP